MKKKKKTKKAIQQRKQRQQTEIILNYNTIHRHTIQIISENI